MDILDLQLSEEPIEGLEEAFNNWEPDSDYPPTRPIKHQAVIRDIAEVKETKGILNITVHFDLKGGVEEGEQLNYIRLNSIPKRKDSIINLVKSAGIEGAPNSIKALFEMVQHMKDSQRPAFFQTGLETYCVLCANEKRAELTGVSDGGSDEAKLAMKNLPNEAPDYQRSNAYRAIEKAARKHTAKSIPTRADGRHQPTVQCPVHEDQELKVRPYINRWLQQATNGSGDAI